MPPTVDQAPLRRPQVGELEIDLAPQLVAHLGERVAREVQAERLLLEGQQLGAVELVAGIGGWWRSGPARLDGLAEVEDRALAERASACDFWPTAIARSSTASIARAARRSSRAPPT